jgi:hypothetical protein
MISASGWWMPGQDAQGRDEGSADGMGMTNDALQERHLCGYRGPADALEVTILNDGKEQVLVGFVVPLGRHGVV